MGEPVNAGAGSGGPDRLAAIQAKADEVGSLYKKAQAARSANRTARIVVVIAILVVVIVFALVLVSFVRHYPKDKLFAELQGQAPKAMAILKAQANEMRRNLEPVYKEAFEKTWPDVKKDAMPELEKFKAELQAEYPTLKAEVENFIAKLKAEWPNVQKDLQGELVALQKQMMDELPGIRATVEGEVGAFRDQFLKEWPDMQAKLEAEANGFINDIENQAAGKMQARLQQIIQRQQDKLVNAFPELKDDAKRQVVMQNLQTAFQAAFKTVMTDRVAGGRERIARFYSKILMFLPESRREGFQQRITTAWDVLLKKYMSPVPAAPK